MAGLTLHDLIEALSNAVIQAQDRVEKSQIRNIRQFFDQDYRPLSVRLRVPSIRPTAEEGDEEIVDVPLISHSQLSIETFNITLDVDLGELTDAAEEEKPADDNDVSEGGAGEGGAKAMLDSAGRHKQLAVDLAAPRTRSRGPTAKVTVRVRGHEPTEGMARMLAELNKRIGVNK